MRCPGLVNASIAPFIQNRFGNSTIRTAPRLCGRFLGCLIEAAAPPEFRSSPPITRKRCCAGPRYTSISPYLALPGTRQNTSTGGVVLTASMPAATASAYRRQTFNRTADVICKRRNGDLRRRSDPERSGVLTSRNKYCQNGSPPCSFPQPIHHNSIPFSSLRLSRWSGTRFANFGTYVVFCQFAVGSGRSVSPVTHRSGRNECFGVIRPGQRPALAE